MFGDKNVLKCMWEAEMRFTDKNGNVEKNMRNVIGNTSFVRTKNSEVTTLKERSDYEQWGRAGFSWHLTAELLLKM